MVFVGPECRFEINKKEKKWSIIFEQRRPKCRFWVFGVYQVEETVCEQCVCDAIAAGYRSIDTASAYLNERAVGRAIRRSGVPREELSSRRNSGCRDAGYEASGLFAKSLRTPAAHYLDLYLIHQPFGDIYGSWRAMEELYREGAVRAIGVSNFNRTGWWDLILHNEVVPAVNPDRDASLRQQTEAAAVMASEGVQIESWAPFAEGRNNLFGNGTLVSLAAKIPEIGRSRSSCAG